MKLSISVPNPCHEEWHSMTPADKGRHCAKCDKVVADLTRTSDADLAALFSSDARPTCARFDPAQLDRVLRTAEEQKRAGPVHLAAFTSLIAVATGFESIGQTPPAITVGEVAINRPEQAPTLLGKSVATRVPNAPPIAEPVIGDTIIVEVPGAEAPAMIAEEPHIPMLGMPMIDLIPAPPVAVCGTVISDATGEPLPFARVSLMDNTVSTSTDENGEFRLLIERHGHPSEVQVRVHIAGFLATTSTVPLTAPPGEQGTGPDIPSYSDPIDPKAPNAILGRVTNPGGAVHGAGVVIRVAGSKLAVRCDDQGAFGLLLPPDLVGGPVKLEVLMDGQVLVSRQLGPNSTPCCVPIEIPAGAPAPPMNPDTACRELGTIRVKERTMLLGVCVVDLPHHRTDRPRSWIGRLWRKRER